MCRCEQARELRWTTDGISILLIHGFGGNLAEIQPLAWHLERSGYSVERLLLPGHSEEQRKLAGTAATAACWRQAVEDRLAELSRQSSLVVLVGFSMGGLLAINAAVNAGAEGVPVALATINTPVYYWNFTQIGRNLRAGGREELRRMARCAGEKSLRSMIEFQRLLWATKPLMRKVDCPMLVLQAADDDTVWPVSAIQLLRRSQGRRRLVMLPDGGHQILQSSQSEAVCHQVEAFVESIACGLGKSNVLW